MVDSLRYFNDKTLIITFQFFIKIFLRTREKKQTPKTFFPIDNTCNFVSKIELSYLHHFVLKSPHLSDIVIHFIVVITEFHEITETKSFLCLDISPFDSAHRFI